MKSSKHGKNTSKINIQGVTTHGLWILALGNEYFLPFNEFPWFRKAAFVDIADVELLHDVHLHWPKLDIDLHLDSLKHLEQFPLLDRLYLRKHKLRSAA